MSINMRSLRIRVSLDLGWFSVHFYQGRSSDLLVLPNSQLSMRPKLAVNSWTASSVR